MWHDHTAPCNEGLVLFWDQFLSLRLSAHVRVSVAKERRSCLRNIRIPGLFISRVRIYNRTMGHVKK